MKLLLSFCFLLVCKLSLSAQTGRVTGKIYNAGTGKGIPFGSIISGNKGTSSDADGNYTWSLPPGRHKLSVTVIDYELKDTVVNVYKDSTVRIDISVTNYCMHYANSNKNNKTCPVCKRQDKVIPIVYGLPLGKLDWSKFYYAGCEITNCDPFWYCKRDKLKF